MSTFTAVGPLTVVDGPLPEQPEYSLLSIPGVRQEGVGRWEGGVFVYGYPQGTPETWEPCSSGTFRVKDEGAAVTNERFDPAGLYLPITCTAASMGDWREFGARAERALEARTSFGVEQVLSQGVVGSINTPFLGDGNVTKLNGGAATSPQTALAYLENALGAPGEKGMIHATPGVATFWAQYLRVENNTLVTIATGTPVAVGGGYIGASANATAPGAGNAWAFASGPVEAFVSESRLVGEDINGTIDTSNNDVTFRAERFVLPYFDTALQVAVLVDWTP
jgi:hypothetical protein